MHDDLATETGTNETGLNSGVEPEAHNTKIAPVETIEAGSSIFRQDVLAVEEPLEIHLNGKPLSITMRTPGNDLDLAIGFLFTEGIVDNVEQILSIGRGHNGAGPGAGAGIGSERSGNSVVADLKPGVEVDPVRVQRNFYTTSSCGVCGKASICALETKPRRTLREPGPVFRADLIYRLPEIVRTSQAVFDRTGGLHAAALFSADGRLLGLREDVGRHNAVDKLIGHGLREKSLPFEESLIFVSGRAGFELVQKAVMAGIPILAAVGAPSSLAVEVAQRFRMTLLGFVRGSRFNVYSGSWRIT